MAGTLTLSSKLSPFPYGAVAIATYTQKADLAFDETATRISLDLSGSNIDTEPEIIQALAKAGGLSDDSSKVRKSTVK
jgi:glutamyl-tRNA synthetase